MPTNGRTELDPCDEAPPFRPAVDEFRDASAPREKLAGCRSQRRDRPAAAEQPESQSIAREALRHIATVEEQQFEETTLPLMPNGHTAGIQTSDDPALDVQDDDDPEPEAHPNATSAQRPGGQEHERRVISRLGSARRHRGHTQNRLSAGRDPQPSGSQPQPRCPAARAPHARSSTKRAREAGSCDVDDQRTMPGVANGDRARRRSVQLQPQRARAEPDPAAGRGTRNGCRGHSYDQSRESALHRPITVNVSVAV